jgi:hypothetical protein
LIIIPFTPKKYSLLSSFKDTNINLQKLSCGLIKG